MKIKTYNIVFLIVILAVFIPKYIFAAEFLLISDKKEFNTNEDFKVDFILNTEGKNINALEGSIVFPADILELNEIRDGGSIINFWVDRPYASSSHIYFSGITPLGYNNDNGFILSLVFHTKKSGNGIINIKNIKLLSNDGVGTEVKSKISNLNFYINSNKNTLENQALKITDNDRPETFKPEITKDENLLNSKLVLIFAAEDKGSGIASYKVEEKKYRFLSLPSWHNAESPYALSDQNLSSYILVKAIDKAGNERVVTLSPTNPIPFYANIEDWFIIITVIIVALLYKKFIWKK